MRTRAWNQTFLARLVIVFSFFLCAHQAAGQNASPAGAKKGWILTWSDEFNGPNNSAVDPTKWVLESGGWGWGNQELEYYTARRENAYVAHGKLVIKAVREKYTGPDGVSRDYTSARLKTLGKFSQTYGRFEARIKIPRGQGMWPAFWMLGEDIGTIGWPACGEIDIMENIGKEPGIVHGSIHGPGYTGSVGLEAPYRLPGRRKFADHFHLYAVEWEPDAIRLYVDKHLYVTRTRADLRPGWKWVFDHPFFLLLNLAVGGDWPGSPDATTVSPQVMLVDYVRVYRRADLSPGK
ncbi:MAG: glycoside hydrolase family 16 protein [Candidatus Sulfotelmatobacter sp.]